MKLSAASLFLLPLAAYAGVSAGSRAAGPTNLQDLDRSLAAIFEAHHVPGAAVVVVENGKVGLSGAYGFADRAAKRPVTAATLFRAGSISKSITSIAVLLLVQEGKLDLNAKLSDLAPEVRFDNPWEATDPVRLVHLLEHTSGFEDLRFRHYLIDGHQMPLRRAIDAYSPYRCQWRPGTYFSYSNAGPVIAGYIVERVSGMSFAEFTRQRIFVPLGMQSARWDQPSLPPELSKSYWANGGAESPYVDIPGKPSGALIATAEDLARLELMLLGRGSLNGVTLLNPEAVKRLETPASSLGARSGLPYGYGLGNYATVSPKAVYHGHNGAIDAFLAEYRYAPEHGSGVVVMLNSNSTEALDAAMAASTDYLERQGSGLPRLAAVPLPASVMKPREGFYFHTADGPRWMDALDLKLPVMVSSDAGSLRIGGVTASAVTPSIFLNAAGTAPAHVAVESPEGMLLLSGMSALRKANPWLAVAKVAFWYGLFFPAVMVTAGALLVWMVGAMRGRIRGRDAWLARLVPAAALLCAPVLIVRYLSAFVADNSEQLLGAVTPVSVEILALTLILPAAAAAAVVVVLRSSSAVGKRVRLLAVWNTTMALGAALHFLSYGWLGLRTWTL
jgi:CubicO group peptidase (beta-lactamase class C family)